MDDGTNVSTQATMHDSPQQSPAPAIWTPEQGVTGRQHFLGASDIPAILGLSPWKTPWEVWAEKTGRAEAQHDTLRMRLGRAAEPILLEWLEAHADVGPLRYPVELNIPGSPIVCHPDALTKDGQPVEAKSVWTVDEGSTDWGETYTSEIPVQYLVQCAVQLEAASADVCYVPTLLYAESIQLYLVQADKALQQDIVELACSWWRKHVEQDTPPPMIKLPSFKFLQRLRRVPKKTIRLNAPWLLDLYEQAQRSKQMAEAQYTLARTLLAAALGDAEAAVFPDGRMVTFYEQTRREHVVAATTYRVLRVRKGDTQCQHITHDQAPLQALLQLGLPNNLAVAKEPIVSQSCETENGETH